MADVCEIAARLIRTEVESWRLPETPLKVEPELWRHPDSDLVIDSSGDTFAGLSNLVGYNRGTDELVLRYRGFGPHPSGIERVPVEEFGGYVQELVATGAAPPIFMRDAAEAALEAAGLDEDDYEALGQAEECILEEYEEAVQDAGWSPFPVTESGDLSDVFISAEVDPRRAHSALRKLLIDHFEPMGTRGLGRLSPSRKRRRSQGARRSARTSQIIQQLLQQARLPRDSEVRISPLVDECNEGPIIAAIPNRPNAPMDAALFGDPAAYLGEDEDGLEVYGAFVACIANL